MNPTHFPLPSNKFLDFRIDAMPDGEDIVAIDWETYYDDEYSLKKMSAIQYVTDPRFNPYLVAIYGTVQGQDIRFCGRPHTFPWDALLACRPIRFIAHNASFDEIVTWRYLSMHGIASLDDLTERMIFECTADMAAYLKYPRALAGFVKVLGLPVPDKTVRDEMKGVDFTKDENLTPRVLSYAMSDARLCHQAWTQLSPLWPARERMFAIRSRRRAYRGTPIHVPEIHAAISVMEQVKHEAEKSIPWDWSGNKTPLSPTAMRAQCVKDEVPIPASFAEANEACQDWEEEYGDIIPWVGHVRDWRKSNTHSSRLVRMSNSLHRDLDVGDAMHFQIMYCGAHTGRSSGTGGVNMQNMPQKKIIGDVNIRNMIKAPKGYKVMIADYNQIEPRLLYLRTGRFDILNLISEGMHPYEAHARMTMNYTDPRPLKSNNPHLYKLAKFRVIGLGYGCGAAKFRSLCKAAGFVIEPSVAEEQVADYRRKHPQTVDFWYTHDRWLQQSAQSRDPTYEFDILSGRTMSVFDPQFVQDEVTGRVGVKARKNRGDGLVSMWGGTMTENEIQGLGMDITKHAVTSLPPSLLRYWILDSHDELVFLLPEEDHEDIGREILKHMTTVPWLPSGFPLAADADYTNMYMKPD